MATNNTSSSNPRAEKMGDVLDALSSGIAKTAANEPKFEPQHLAPEVPAEPARQLLTEIMLADRWVCSVARLQRWRTTVEWHPKLSHFEENLHPNLSHPNRLSCLIFEQTGPTLNHGVHCFGFGNWYEGKGLFDCAGHDFSFWL